jgi:hypothetical protein
VLEDQVIRPQLDEPWMGDEGLARGRERANDELDFPPKAGTRRFSLSRQALSVEREDPQL